MMDHPTRNKLAHALAARLTALYGDQIMLVGAFGSLTRGEDTPWSDLDMLVITRPGAGIASRTFIYQSIPVVLNTVDQVELEASLARPGPRWPYWMGVLDVLQTLAGDQAQIRRWQDLGLSLDDQAFRAAAVAYLPGLVFESYGRIRSCAARKNERDAPMAAIEVIFEICTALCLLNRRWVTRDYYTGIEQSFSFALRPQDYEQLVSQLWVAHELDQIVALAGALVASYWRLLASCAMTPQNYQTLESLPL